MKMNQGLAKTKSTSNLGLGPKSRLSAGPETMEKLKKELEAAQQLITSLRGEQVTTTQWMQGFNRPIDSFQQLYELESIVDHC